MQLMNNITGEYEALFHEPLARVIAQALPVFDIKFTNFTIYNAMILNSPDMSDSIFPYYWYISPTCSSTLNTYNKHHWYHYIFIYLLVSMVKRNKYSEKVIIPRNQRKYMHYPLITNNLLNLKFHNVQIHVY